MKKVDRIIEGRDSQKASLVMILQDVQEEYRYLPQPALERVASRIDVPLTQVYNVATFYSSFSLTERGEHLIRICDGTACHLRGAMNIQDEITRQIGIEAGQTTADKKFTFETVACLGACALAPVMTIDSQYHGNLDPEKLKQILDDYK